MSKTMFPIRLGPCAENGIDFKHIIESLKSIGYTGYVTSHQALVPGAPPLEAIARYADFLARFI